MFLPVPKDFKGAAVLYVGGGTFVTDNSRVSRLAANTFLYKFPQATIISSLVKQRA